VASIENIKGDHRTSKNDSNLCGSYNGCLQVKIRITKPIKKNVTALFSKEVKKGPSFGSLSLQKKFKAVLFRK
jgi:hypothetical protein